MNRGSWWFAAMAVVLFGAISVSSLAARTSRRRTFTGEVGDAMCGRKHMEGSPADCTRTCVAHGSRFALIVGEKIYLLDTTDGAALALLNQQAGKTATVSGVLNDDTIEVHSVAAK